MRTSLEDVWAEKMLYKASLVSAEGNADECLDYLFVAFAKFPNNQLIKGSLSHYADKRRRMSIDESTSAPRTHGRHLNFTEGAGSQVQSFLSDLTVLLGSPARLGFVALALCVLTTVCGVTASERLRTLFGDNGMPSPFGAEPFIALEETRYPIIPFDKAMVDEVQKLADVLGEKDKQKDIAFIKFSEKVADNAPIPRYRRTILATDDIIIQRAERFGSSVQYVGIVWPASSKRDAIDVCEELESAGISVCKPGTVADLLKKKKFIR